MVPSCAALIGYICIASPAFPPDGTQTTISISSGINIGGAVEVKSGRWGARFFSSTHFRAQLNPDAMEDACADGTCIKYHRKCDNPVQPRICDFVIMSPGVPGDRVHVEGEDVQAFQSAIARLDFVIRESGVLVPFTAMNREARIPNPYCRYTPSGPDTAVADQPGCPQLQRRQ